MDKILLEDVLLGNLSLGWFKATSDGFEVDGRSSYKMVKFIQNFGPSGNMIIRRFFDWVEEETGGTVSYETESDTEIYLVFDKPEEQLAFLLRWS